jgi:3-methylfumaryl-CoA hydratase
VTEALDPKLAEWIGRSASDTDIVTPAMVDALDATLGYDIMPRKEGDQAPQGIHWLCGTQKSRTQDLGADGHTLLGLVLPPVKLPRRMWAGSVIDFHRPIRVGDRIERRSTIRSITPKTGSAGPLVFVEVEHDIRTSGERALTEVHTIVFRGPPDTIRHGKTESMGSAVNGRPPDIRYTLHPNEVMLFRYSALTFNSHRIHYDYPYVTKVEGYPGLVVHGPLIATLLINAVNNRFGGDSLKRFSFRGVAPAYCNDPLTIEARTTAEGFALRAVSGDGRLVMTAEGSL